MGKIKVGPCRHLVLLGGGEFLLELVKEARLIGYTVEVVTSPRHAEGLVDSRQICDILDDMSVPFMIVEDIEQQSIKEHFCLVNKFSLFLSISAAWIFKKDYILEVFRGKLFNSHGTRLPQNRGGGGYSWQIMTANRFGFCMLHLVDGGIDTGDIVSFDEFIYPHYCKYPVHYQKYFIGKNLSFLKEVMIKIYDSCAQFDLVGQNEYLSTYWPRLNQNISSWIDWSIDPMQLERFICAFDDPYSGAKTTLNGNIVRLKKVHVSYQDGVFHPFQRGIVYRKNKKWLCVALDGASLIIESIIDDELGVSCLSTINVGDRFITPNSFLEQAKERVIYTPTGMK